MVASDILIQSLVATVVVISGTNMCLMVTPVIYQVVIVTVDRS